MKIIAKILIGLLTAIFVFGFLGFARNGLLDKPGLLIFSFLGPILIPIIFAFLPTVQKTIGAAFIAMGAALTTMPIGLRSIVNEATVALQETETQNVTESISKSILMDVMGTMGKGMLWFGPWSACS